MTYQVSKPDLEVKGRIALDGSKSISNRALIIRALSGLDFPIDRLSTSRDTTTMVRLLQGQSEVYDTGAAGTTFRFLTAYLALQTGTQTLTGSERMKQRPIGGLVEALRQLGAQIDYVDREGFPPLRIHAPKITSETTAHLAIPAHISSQFISALLMIGPCLPQGLQLQLIGKVVSRPYIEMTLRLMAHFGVTHHWEGDTIKVEPQAYQARPFTVEADWSAASYYYAIAAFSPHPDLYLDGLTNLQLQGDAVLVEMMEHFGIRTRFIETEEHVVEGDNDATVSKTVTSIHLSRFAPARQNFSWDFIRCPDIAQTLAVICGGLGVEGKFTGLDTLSIKETDRIAALRTELQKVGVRFEAIEQDQDDHQWYQVSGKASVLNHPVFPTYEDHRMAMAFAPLGMLGTIAIEEPDVVAKSYPAFWRDLASLGFEHSEETLIS